MRYFLLLYVFLCQFFYAQQDIEGIRKRLQSNDFLVKSQTLQEVVFLYEDAIPLIPDLLKMLPKEKGQNKYLIIQALGNIGEEGELARLPLEKIVKESDDFFLSYYSIIALGQIGHLDSVPVLLEEMENEEPNIRAAVIAALNAISPPEVISLFKKYSDDSNALVQKAIITSMQLRKFDTDVSDILIKNLTHSDGDVRFLAVQLLEITPENVNTVLPLYLKLLHSQDARIVSSILGDFAIARKLAEPAIPEIIPFLMQKNYQNYASYALGKIGDASLPYLEKLLTSNKEVERQQSVNMISKLGHGNAYVNLLIKMSVEDESVNVRVSCLSALALLDNIREEDKDYLQKKLFSEKQVQTIQTIGVLKLPSFVPDLVKILENKDVSLRKNIYLALASIALKEPSIDNILLMGLQENDKEIQQICIRSLGKIKSAAAIPELRKLLQDGSHYILAIIALGEIGESAVETLPDINKIFHQNPNRSVKNYCMHAMVKMGNKAIPFFLDSLDSKDNIVRFYSLTGLVQLEPTAEVLAKLKEVSERDIPVSIKRKALEIYNYLMKQKSLEK